MKYYDVTMPVSPEMLAYTGDPVFYSENVIDLDKGDKCTVSKMSMGSHMGTHIDAPAHFIKGGATVDQLQADKLCGKVKVFHIPNKAEIEVSDIESLDICKDDIVFFKTRNSELLKKDTFDPEYTYLTPEAARFLVEKGIKTVGIDYLSIDKFGEHGAHIALLSEGIVITEGLMLSDVPSGEYQMAAVPMKIKGGNGAPIGIILSCG